MGIRKTTMTTCFVMPEENLTALGQLDPDRDWQQFVTGERAWILQTFLRLQNAGMPVELKDRLPLTGVAIFSSKHRRRLLAMQRTLRTRALLVATREDVNSTPFADIDIVQNPSQARPRKALLMPHWPQPGLIPRDAQRGNTLLNVAYKGFAGNLHPSFRDAEWLQFLEQRGLRWQADAVRYSGASAEHGGLSWNDFSATDLIVAVRPDDPGSHPRKPATKLYNAWQARVPCLLGPELAYRALRRDPLDYLEVRDRFEAAAAIDALLQQPERYRAMIEHGSERAREFSVAAITDRWRELIMSTLPALAADRPGRVHPLWLRQLYGRIQRASVR
jgi:hypothetical protein